jgi:tetratricopeptide (TPR) repeat protein
MAGRVNTKFVVLLVAAAVVVLGSGIGLYAFMFNKTGDTYAAAALEAEAAGDWEAAEENWGRAVGHENTNVEWLDAWANSLGHIVPETETEYRDKFNQFRSIKRQAAVTARTDPDRTADYLNLFFESFSRLGGGSRGAVENFANEVAFMLAYYPEGGPQQSDRDRLRRFRGRAWAQIAGQQSTLTEDEIGSAKDDLAAALGVDPSDGVAMRALVRLLDTEKARAQADDDPARVASIVEAQRDAVAGVLEADPENLWAQITAMDIDTEAFTRLSGEAREASRVALYDRLDAVLRLAESRIGDASGAMLERLTILEGVLDPAGSTPRAIALLETAVEAGNEPTEMLLQLAALRERMGDFEGAMRDATRAEAQESLPVSLEGYIRLFARRQAPLYLAEFAVKRVDDAETDERVQELLSKAAEARDRFITGVGTENPRVAMLDGQIAAARAQYLLDSGDQRGGETALNEALGHFAAFNQKTQYTNREGLWREGLAALRLNKTGLARERLGALLAMEPSNANVLLGLADVEERLATEASIDEAYRYTERAAELAPGNAAIRERLERLGKLSFRDTPDDPIEAIVFGSEGRFQGRGLPAPDAMGAETMLREGIAEHGQDPRLVRQLVRILMFTDRLEEAREVTNEAFRVNPDSDVIQQLKTRLEADSMLAIVEQTILESSASELDKLLQIVEARRLYGEPEMAAEALTQAKAIAPDDPDVIEQEFLQELDARNIEAATAIAERATAANADRLDGITYQARVFAAQNRHAESVELLREAVARRPADAPLWRLLATEQSALGRVSEALESYRQSLSITLNDSVTIRGYVALLATTGQLDEALSEARRLREFGDSDPAFVDMYLRLEANQGGDEGLARAIRRRRQILGEQPFNISNKLQLARLYIEDRDWEQSKGILDQLDSEGKGGLGRVEMLAKWYADQGRVKQGDDYVDGIELARGAFIEHIVGAAARARRSTRTSRWRGS